MLIPLEGLCPSFIGSNGFVSLLESMKAVGSGDSEQEKLVCANAALIDIEDEAISAFKALRDRYSIRFPELETFELGPIHYAKVVLALENAVNALDTSKLSSIPGMSNATVMIVSVTAASTKGRPLREDEWQAAKQAAELILNMSRVKEQILKFIESRMDQLAPNVSALVGVAVTSQLMGSAGGIVQLSRIPAGNIQVIGSGGRKHLSGLSSASVGLHSGFIAQAPLMAEISPDLYVKAQRFLAAKVAIASRIDAAREHRDGSFGRGLYDEIVGKLEKLSEPPPLKTVKPLPIPDSERKKRRGGKRARNLKELYAQTESRRQRNRMAFGETAEVEVFVGDRMEGLGMLGASTGTGNIRLLAAGSHTDARLRDHLKKQAQGKLSTTGASGQKSSQSQQNNPQSSSNQSSANTQTASSRPSSSSRYFNSNSGFRRNKD